MYIKTKSGDYVNSKNISGLRIFCDDGMFYVLAHCIGDNFEPCFYISSEKEAAQAYMTLMANHLDEVEEAATMQSPLQSEPQHAASKNTKLSAMLTALVDDFAASGDTDNLLKINAYIRMYLQQEANHE